MTQHTADALFHPSGHIQNIYIVTERGGSAAAQRQQRHTSRRRAGPGR